MALILDYAPGMNLADPLPFVVARAHPIAGATRFSLQGTVVTVPANTLRDNHYLGGVRTTLLEIATNNNVLQSQAWATGGTWSFNVLTATNNAAAAPDGTITATQLLPNNTVSSGNPYVTQGSIAITSGENLSASFFVKANGYGAVVLRCSDSGSTNGFQVSFDLVNGAFGSLGNGFGAGVLTGKTFVPLANGWYWVGIWGQINAAVTAASVFCYVYDTIAHANTQAAYIANGTSSVLGWGAQLERWGTSIKGMPTSYIATTTGILGRDSDAVSMTWPFQTQPMWGYIKFIDLGWSQRAAFEPLVMFTDSILGNPTFKIFTGSGTPGTSPNHRANYANGTPGGTQSAAILSPGVNYGDTVELFWQLFADGSVGLQRSINGAAVTTVVNSGATPDFLDFASHNGGAITLYISDGAQVGVLRMKLGFGTSLITTLAQGAAA